MDADALIERRWQRHGEAVERLGAAEARPAALEEQRDGLLKTFEESGLRMLGRRAELERDQVEAAMLEAECEVGVRQEIGHRNSIVAGALLGWLKAFSENRPEQDAEAEVSTVALEQTLDDVPGPVVEPEMGPSNRRRLLATLLGGAVLLLSGLAALLTHIVWLFVGPLVLLVLLAVGLLLRPPAAPPAPLPPSPDSTRVDEDVPEIEEWEIAPAGGLRRYVWQPRELVPAYRRVRGSDPKNS